MFKDTKEGQTQYCEACEEEARLDRSGKSHICGINPPTVKEEQHMDKNWEKEFDDIIEHLPTLDNSRKLNNHWKKKFKSFISNLLAHQKEQQIKEERERIRGALPLEQIHQLPDDVGSPHETEFDRGRNSYRKDILSILK